MTPTAALLAVLLAPLLLAACAEMRLPDLAVPLGNDTTFGTDLRADDPVLGITVTDPFDRLPG
jgi:hypothetical protein